MDCPLRCSSFLPLRPERLLCRLAQPPPSTGLGFARWKRRESERCLVVCKAFGFDEQGGGSRGFSKTTALKVFMEEAIGAEYGEGFETFRPEGPLKVDVDFLNDRMQESCLQRIRYVMKPDEAFGLIFTWDNVLADTRALKLDAWYQLALEEGKDIPEDNNIRRTLTYAGADHIFTKVLHWVDGDEQLERLKLRLSELYFDNLQNLRAPTEGVKEWLDALYTVGIPCAVTSRLDRTTLIAALKRMGLKKYFQAMVTEEDGMDSIAHRFLSAAVKLDRSPSKCVVFEDDPRGITAAHNCTMMAVALIGARPAYELVQADLAVASFSELSIINLRRLFAHKGSAFMDLQKQIGEIAPRRRKLTIDTVF